MTDRIPIQVLGNGAIRYGIYNADGSLNRYEYIKLEDAATVTGTALNVANLLSATTANKIAAAMGVTAPTTVNEALNDMATPPIYQKLLSSTVSGTTQSVILNLASIDLTQYSALRVNMRVLGTQTYASITMNGITSYDYVQKQSSTETITTGAYLAQINLEPNYMTTLNMEITLPKGSPGCTKYVLAHITSVVWSAAVTAYKMLDSLGALTLPSATNLTSIELTVAGAQTINAGSEFVVYGVKK